MGSFLPNVSTVGAFIAMLLGFGFIIFVHELGHFLAAKWVGVRVTQFSICFGHAICTWRKGIGVRFGSTEPEYQDRVMTKARQMTGKHDEAITQREVDVAAAELGLGETEYRLNWIPLGGYVKMVGQEDLKPIEAGEDDPGHYMSKSVGARMLIISAGVIMNLIFAVIFFIIAFMAGVEFPPAIVGGVQPNSPAATAYAIGYEDDPAYRGLQAGDRVTEIDGEPINDFTDLRMSVALAASGQELDLTVLRSSLDGDTKKLNYRLLPEASAMSENLLSIGVSQPISNQIAIAPNMTEAAEQFGLRTGMKIIEVAGQPVERYDQFANIIENAGSATVPAVFVDPETGDRVEVQLPLQPAMSQTESDEPVVLGIVPPTRVTAVMEGGMFSSEPAHSIGVKPDDVFARVGSKPWPNISALKQEIQAAGTSPVVVVVYRDVNAPTPEEYQALQQSGQTRAEPKYQVLELGKATPQNGMLGVGIAPFMQQALIGYVDPESPAAALDLPPGTQVLSIAGQDVANFRELFEAAREAVADIEGPTDLAIRYKLPIADQPELEGTLSLSAEDVAQLKTPRYQVGGELAGIGFMLLQEPVKARTPIAATMLGIDKTGEFMWQTYITLKRLVWDRTVQVSHLRGPVGIAHVGTQVAQRGWTYLLFFMALISVNLAVINFLPIPIVDGGHMVFLMIEKIKGSPVSVQVQNAATIAGLILIGSIFLMTTFFDVARLIG